MIYASLSEAWDSKPVMNTKVVLTDPQIVKYFHSFEEEPDLVVRRLLEASEKKEKIESFRDKKVKDYDIVPLFVLLFLILFY